MHPASHPNAKRGRRSVWRRQSARTNVLFCRGGHLRSRRECLCIHFQRGRTHRRGMQMSVAYFSNTRQKLFWPTCDWNNNARLKRRARPRARDLRRRVSLAGWKHTLISFPISPAQPNLRSQCRPLVQFNYLPDNNVGSLSWQRKTTVIAQQVLHVFASTEKTSRPDENRQG